MSKVADWTGDGYRQDDPDAPWNREHKAAPARKDTRRWCRGKVGREHTLAIVRDDYGWHVGRKCQEPSWLPGYWSCHHQERCTTCGKILRPSLPREQCPQWMEANA